MKTRKLKKRFVPCYCKQKILSKRYVDSVSSEHHASYLFLCKQSRVAYFRSYLNFEIVLYQSCVIAIRKFKKGLSFFFSLISFWLQGAQIASIAAIKSFHCDLGRPVEKLTSMLILPRFKVARPSIFVATPSIFEYPILKQINLHCKTHYNTCITHRRNFMILFFGR